MENIGFFSCTVEIVWLPRYFLFLSGVVTIVSPLDYESSQQTWVVVVAVDDGRPSLTSTATVNIRVGNENDEAPVFVADTPVRRPHPPLLSLLSLPFPSLLSTDPLTYTFTLILIETQKKHNFWHNLVFLGFRALSQCQFPRILNPVFSSLEFERPMLTWTDPTMKTTVTSCSLWRQALRTLKSTTLRWENLGLVMTTRVLGF